MTYQKSQIINPKLFFSRWHWCNYYKPQPFSSYKWN